MAKKIVSTSSARKRIRDIGASASRLEPRLVADALGAEEAGTEIGLKGSPVTFLQLRAELADRLQSSGGRPSLEGVTRRVKIPVTDRQWQDLEDLAASLADQEFSPSAGQVASVLLSLSLTRAKSDAQRLKDELVSHAGAGRSDLSR